MTNKCYIQLYSPNKAKNDLDDLMRMDRWRNIGSVNTKSGKIKKFFVKLGIIARLPFLLRPHELLLIQYPFKKYYNFICRIAHWKQVKVVVLIHDLGSFRRHKLTVQQEVQKLELADYVIVHNEAMRQWLLDRGCRVPMGNLEIFDYLSETKAIQENPINDHPVVIYAGGLGIRKNAFLYQLDEHISTYEMEVYGNGLDMDLAKEWKHIHYKGFMPSDQLIKTNRGHFGLVWDGDSMDGCSGNWGEYLKYNNPHKTSFYIRCHLPIIIWNKAALAPFIRKHHIGICVDSVKDIDRCIREISAEEYEEIRHNVIAMSKRLSEGYYFHQAIDKACKVLNK